MRQASVVRRRLATAQHALRVRKAGMGPPGGGVSAVLPHAMTHKPALALRHPSGAPLTRTKPAALPGELPVCHPPSTCLYVLPAFGRQPVCSPSWPPFQTPCFCCRVLGLLLTFALCRLPCSDATGRCTKCGNHYGGTTLDQAKGKCVKCKVRAGQAEQASARLQHSAQWRTPFGLYAEQDLRKRVLP